MQPKTLALVTIGQAPRDDVTPDIAPLLEGYRVIETGALDELSAAEIAALAPAPGEGVLVSRLRGGGSAVLAEDRLHPLIQAAVDRAVAAGATAVLVICTGDLVGITAPVPLFMAGVARSRSRRGPRRRSTPRRGRPRVRAGCRH
ncbi:MAG: AroM family protein [Microbacteriaceae bacterium]